HLFNRQLADTTVIPYTHKFIGYSLKFLSINMVFGTLGYGMAFYNHGYSNALGTKGFIYAGNELTILLLAISFAIALWFYLNKQFKKYFIYFGLVMFFAFLMTSKTALGGVLIVFLIPPLSQIKFVIRKKWIDYLILILGLALPMLSYIFYVGI